MALLTITAIAMLHASGESRARETVGARAAHFANGVVPRLVIAPNWGRPIRPGRPYRPPPPPPPPPPTPTWGQGTPRMLIRRLDVDGPARGPAVRAVVTSHADASRDCYAGALRAHPGSGGSAVLRFVIAPDGTVSASTVVSTDPAVAEPSQCVAAAVRAWVFATNATGRSSVATVSVTFDRRGADEGSSAGGSRTSSTLTIPGTLQGTLVANGPHEPSGRLYRDYPFTLARGQSVTIVVRANPQLSGVSLDMYAILRLGGAQLAVDDDSAGNLNSRIVFTAQRAGRYTLRVTTFGSEPSPGSFTVQTWAGEHDDAQ